MELRPAKTDTGTNWQHTQHIDILYHHLLGYDKLVSKQLHILTDKQQQYHLF